MQLPEPHRMVITLVKNDRRVTVELELGEMPTTTKVEHLRELQALLASCDPICIFLDLHLPITVAVQLIDVIRASHPGVPITTRVETNQNGSRYFTIKAERRGIVLQPL